MQIDLQYGGHFFMKLKKTIKACLTIIMFFNQFYRLTPAVDMIKDDLFIFKDEVIGNIENV